MAEAPRGRLSQGMRLFLKMPRCGWMVMVMVAMPAI